MPILYDIKYIIVYSTAVAIVTYRSYSKYLDSLPKVSPSIARSSVYRTKSLEGALATIVQVYSLVQSLSGDTFQYIKVISSNIARQRDLHSIKDIAAIRSIQRFVLGQLLTSYRGIQEQPIYFDLYTRSIIPAERLLQGRRNNRIVYYQIYLSKDTTCNSIGQAQEGVLNEVRQRQSILQRQLVDLLTIVARGCRDSGYYRLVLIINGTLKTIRAYSLIYSTNLGEKKRNIKKA